MKNYMKTMAFVCVLSIGVAFPVLAADTASSTIAGDTGPVAEGAGMPPNGPMDQMPPGGFNPPDHITQGTAANTITKNTLVQNETYTSTENDENALRITGASAVLTGVTVHKTSGTSSNTEGGDFYGMNAAILVTDGASLQIEDSIVTSSTANGNGLFSYGNGTTVEAKNVTITTTGRNSGGIQTTGGATTIAHNLMVTTSGDLSASIRSDRGGGTVQVTGGTFKTVGYGSPAIYSTANISVNGAKLMATHSEGAVIEGKNSITLKNCDLEGSMANVRTMGNQKINEENVHTIMIYQSMSGDAEQGQSCFTMKGGSLRSHRGDVIYVTNTDCQIHLENVDIENLDSQGALLRITGNSASRGWGQQGANGGTAVMTTKQQQLNGDIVVDSISRLDYTMEKGTTFTGAMTEEMNTKGTRSDNGVHLIIEKGATWNLTGDSTVTTLENHGKINTNGHTLTVLNNK